MNMRPVLHMYCHGRRYGQKFSKISALSRVPRPMRLCHRFCSSSSKRKPDRTPKRLPKYFLLFPAAIIGGGVYLICSRVVEDNTMENQRVAKHVQHRPDHEQKHGNVTNPDVCFLHIQVIQGELLSGGYDLFQHPDPYVEVEYEHKKQKTKAVRSTQKPIWNHSMKFKQAKLGGDLTVCLWDFDHLTDDDFVGTVTLTPDQLPSKYNELRELEVVLKNEEGKDTAKVVLAVEFTGYNKTKGAS